MPTNQAQSNSASQPNLASKTNLVRSKSLRLPSSSKPRPETATNSLTRHGSIRQTKSQGSSASGKPPLLASLRKPTIKPKPVAFGSKSAENLDKVTSRGTYGADSDAKRHFPVSKSPPKYSEGPHGSKVTFLNNSYPSPSDSPTSLHSDRSQHSQDVSCSWGNPDLAIHLKRLTEEHEKLQVEYARVRMQLLESATSQYLPLLRKDHQHLSQSDSHLASIPENTSGSCLGTNDQNPLEKQVQIQETVIHGYRQEILRIQEENRKLQRKYWEQVLNSESIEDINGGASQQVVELIDKLDDKQRELVQATGRVQELENHMAAIMLELHQCQDALQDYQHMLQDVTSQKERLEKHVKESQATLKELRENLDFLQEERSTIAEALQETEQSLAFTKAELKREQTCSVGLMDRARKLYAKVKDKNLQIQLLQADLDRTQGKARDMLLSQGAELTMTAMYLSQISISLHSVLSSASDFAASELGLQKEMLEEIMADLDSESEKSDFSPTDDLEIAFKIPEKVDMQITPLDVYKPFPEVAAADMPESPSRSSSSSSGSERPASIVQMIVQALESSNKNNEPAPKLGKQQKSLSENSVSNSVKSSSENLSFVNVNSKCFNKSSSQSVGELKPVGTATAFRPVNSNRRELNNIPSVSDARCVEEERKKASLETQLNQLNTLLGKLVKVIELMQMRYLAKMQALKDEIKELCEDLNNYKVKEEQLKRELSIKEESVVKIASKLNEALTKAATDGKKNSEDKEGLLQQISDLTEKNKILESVNAEQTRQLKEEVQQMVSSSSKKDNNEFFSNAVAICDKLSLKQEIVKLKETVLYKEQLLQKLTQKFARTKKVLEENLLKADSEVECLDLVIEKVYETLQRNPDLVQSSEILQNLLTLLSGNATTELRAITHRSIDLIK